MAVLAIASALAVPVAANANAEPPQTMVQLGTWGSPALLGKNLAEACTANSGDLVLMDVASRSPEGESVLNTDLLDEAVRFFPGAPGGGCEFDRVFVGTIDLTAYYPGNAYSSGVVDAAWTANYVALSLETARSFADYMARTAPARVEWNWYLTFEGMLDYLAAPPPGGPAPQQIASAYAGFLADTARALDGVHRADRFLWSPGASVPPGAFSDGALGTALADGIGRITRGFASALAEMPGRNDGPDGALIIDMQDHVGLTDCTVGITPTSAAAWMGLVAKSAVRAELRINVEMFRHADPADCASGIRAAYRSAIDARVRYYAAQGLRVGASFELRFWSELYGSSGERGTAALEGAEISELHQAGERLTLTARLIDADARPIAGKTVALVRCDTTWGGCVTIAGDAYSVRTDSQGAVSIPTPVLDQNVHYRLAFAGDDTHLSAEGPPASAYVVIPGGRGVSWSGVTSSAAEPGEAGTIEATLTVTGVGWAMEGAEVLLVRCATAVDCSNGLPVAEAVAGRGGKVQARTPPLDGGPPFYQLRFFGNGGYAEAASPIAVVERATERAGVWSSVHGSEVTSGGISTISGALSDASSGGSVQDGDVTLLACASANDCRNGTAVAVGRLSGGRVEISTPVLTDLPAYFALRSTAGMKRSEESPIVTLGNPAGLAVAWDRIALSPADDSDYVTLNARLSVAGLGWTMDGAHVIAELCESCRPV